MFISVASAYQAAIANGCGLFSRKILPKNKKLVEVFQQDAAVEEKRAFQPDCELQLAPSNIRVL